MNENVDPSAEKDGLYPDVLSVIGLALFTLGISLSCWLLLQSIDTIACMGTDMPVNGYSLLLQ